MNDSVSPRRDFEATCSRQLTTCMLASREHPCSQPLRLNSHGLNHGKVCNRFGPSLTLMGGSSRHEKSSSL
eukprot:4898892-Amphidinium_carterae.1